MSVVGSQQQTFLRMVDALRPHWRRDAALPARIQALLSNRSFGSRDRRLYRELIYTTLRYLPWVEPHLDADRDRAVKLVAWLSSDTRDTTAFRAAWAGDWPAVGSLAERAAFLNIGAERLVPAWMRPECPAIFTPSELEAQVARAPLWLRLQTDDPDAVAKEFASHGWRWAESQVTAGAWRLLDEADLTKTAAFAQGAFEIQDLGSQLVLESVDLASAGRWLDGCAGAGGKTLQLAGLLGARGTVDAYDVRPDALDELVARARRAALSSVTSPSAPAQGSCHLIDDKFPAGKTVQPSREDPETCNLLDDKAARTGGRGDERQTKKDTAGKQGQRGAAGIRVLRDRPEPDDGGYDGVLVDAPCSGSGTWRRSPHLKWTTTPELLAERATAQRTLLDHYARFVRSGGLLVYATCSLARAENEAVVAAFLESHSNFETVAPKRTFGFAANDLGLTILPARHDTDGFFVACLRRR